jgi:Tol biopolymer transport system component
LSMLSLPAGGGVVEPTQISMPPGHVVQVSAASDVVVFRHIGPDQQGHIWKVDGNSAKQVTSGGGENLVDISPDGSMIAFSRTDSTRGVWIQQIAGGEPKLVSPTAITVDGNGGGFSPDSKYVGTLDFVAEADGLIRNVFKVVPVDGGATFTTVRLPQGAANFSNLPPRGITYVNRRDPNWNVFVLNIVGEQTSQQVTRFTDGRVTDALGAPDAKHIAVVRRMEDGENVWVTNADGTQPKQITHFSGLDVLQIKWMPDSKRVACTAGHTGDDVALIRNFR